MNNYTQKSQIIKFIKSNSEPINLNELTSLSQLKHMLEQLVENREKCLNEEYVYHKDWLDDEILVEAQYYIDELNDKISQRTKI